MLVEGGRWGRVLERVSDLFELADVLPLPSVLYSMSEVGSPRSRIDALEALGRRRGRRKPHPLETENRKLRKRAERAEAELEKARKVITSLTPYRLVMLRGIS